MQINRFALTAFVYGFALLGLSERAAAGGDSTRLGRDLTPLGGEKAGNAAGTIPAWDGGYHGSVPANGSHRPDPFPNEKPILVITAQNVQQYADKLPLGALELFKHYPQTYRIEVYPAHRTASAPQWVYDNTKANVTRAKLVHDGLQLEGAFGGPPFPIPSQAKEVMWNMQLPWRGSEVDNPGEGYVITAAGGLVLAARVDARFLFAYYNPGGSPAEFNGTQFYAYTRITDPPYQNGNATLLTYTTDPVSDGSPAWQYLPGQRRIRKAPNFVYDQPNFFTSGVGQFDEAFGFIGGMDRYDWKLIGKKEMFVPYNANRWWTATAADQTSPKHHENPDLVRWELHRVWEVEATLKPGSRNVIGKRHLYIDEDSWNAEYVDEWDNSGSYWRYIQLFPALCADLPAQVSITYDTHDFKAGNWAIAQDITAAESPQWKTIKYDPGFFTPGNLAAVGVR